MPDLLLGTEAGVLRLQANGRLHREEGPPDVALPVPPTAPTP